MKNTLLRVLMMALFITGSVQLFAQDGRFSLGAELALPMGTFGDQTGTGFGASVRYEYPMTDNIALTGTIGYLTFGSKTVDLGPFGSYKYTNSFIPVQVGVKYYLTKSWDGLYLMGELGIHSFSSKAEVTMNGASQSATASSTNLSFAPGVGYHLENIDIGARYQIISTTGASSSYLGIRVAYVFGGK